MVGRLDRGALAWYGREERWVSDPSSDYLDPKKTESDRREKLDSDPN